MVLSSRFPGAALIAATLALSPAAVFAQDAAPAAAATGELTLPSIVVTTAQTRPLVDRVVATGTLRAVEEIQVQPLVEGLSIKTLKADIGDRVAADAVLAELSDDSLLLQKSQLQAQRARAEAALSQYQAQLTEAQVNAEEAERQRVRALTLGSNGTMSSSQVDQAKTSAASATARVESTRHAISIAQADIKVVDAQIADIDLRLQRTGVRTTVAGVVSSRNARVGAIASGSGQPLFTLIRDGEIELVADVSETEIMRVRVGQKAVLFVGGSNERLPGSVRLVAPTVDPVTRLGAVHIAIDEDDRVRAGMFARAEIIVQEATDVALPLTAVTTDRHGSSARRVENGVVKQVKIETGIEDSGFVQIKNGLADGDTVVAKAGAFVRNGDRIHPVPAEAARTN